MEPEIEPDKNDLTYLVCDEPSCGRPMMPTRTDSWVEKRFEINPSTWARGKARGDTGSNTGNWLSCECWKKTYKNNQEQNEAWYVKYVSDQIKNIPEGTSEVNMFLSHRHDFFMSTGGKRMHLSLFPPNSSNANMWEEHISHVAGVLEMLQKRTQGANINIFVASSIGPILAVVFALELGYIATNVYGGNSVIPYNKVRLWIMDHTLEGEGKMKYILANPPVSRKEIDLKTFAEYVAREEPDRCEGRKPDKKRCTRPSVKDKFCHQHQNFV